MSIETATLAVLFALGVALILVAGWGWERAADGPKHVGTVASTGGGELRVLIDRDLDLYPALGSEVFVVDREP